jgi:hypothetical protein
MKGIILTVCFALLTVVGCVTSDRPESVTQDQQDTMTRVEKAAVSSPASDTATDINLLTDPASQVKGGAEPQLKCIVDGECASCCHGGRCCSACGNGPVVCT